MRVIVFAGGIARPARAHPNRAAHMNKPQRLLSSSTSFLPSLPPSIARFGVPRGPDCNFGRDWVLRRDGGGGGGDPHDGVAAFPFPPSPRGSLIPS